MPAGFKAHVDLANLDCKWFAPSLIFDLPFPGTQAFKALVDDLGPFKPEANRIAVEAPTGKVSDVAIRFGLRDGDIDLAFFYTGFRLLLRPFDKSYEKDLAPLVKCAASHVGIGGLVSPGGRFSVRYQAHLRFPEASVDAIFQEVVVSRVSGFEPNGCSFSFRPPDLPRLKAAKLLVEHSAKIELGLFLECNLEFDGSGDLDPLPALAMEVVGYAIESIGILL